jgi:hypothetical protein
MSNSNPGNDDAKLHCRDAIGIRVFLHASQISLPRTDGRRLSLLPKEGGGAPNGAPRWPRLVALARPRPGKRAARLSALLRGHAPGLLPTRPGPRFLESPDANGRTLSGTSAASTSRSDTRRTGRCPGRLQAKRDERRPQEPHPLRQSASPVDVPYDERDGHRYSNPRPRCQSLFDLCRQIAGLRRAMAAARQPGRVSLHCKDSQKRSCACQSRLSVLRCESLRGCTAACEFA